MYANRIKLYVTLDTCIDSTNAKFRATPDTIVTHV